MKFFTLIKNDAIHIAPNKKVIPTDEFSKLLEAQEILKKIHQEIEEYRREVEKACVDLKEKAKQEGFTEGLATWNQQLALLEEEKQRVEEEVNKAIVPLALTAVKKILGKELEIEPKTITDIVHTALKPVSQHRKITIYVNKEDLDFVEEDRAEIKKLFEHLDSLSIKMRDDVAKGGCIIETEAGIINAQLDSQLKALEAAFQNFFDQKRSS